MGEMTGICKLSATNEKIVITRQHPEIAVQPGELHQMAASPAADRGRLRVSLRFLLGK
jgi:hypothetical protein